MRWLTYPWEWAFTLAQANRRWGPGSYIRADEEWVRRLGDVEEGAVVRLAHDRFTLSAPLTIGRQARVVGDHGRTVFTVDGYTGAGPMVTLGDGCTLEDVEIVGDGASATVAVFIDGDDVTVRNVRLSGFAGAIIVNAKARFRIEGCKITSDAGTGIAIRSGSSGGLILGNYVDTARNPGTYAIVMLDPVQMTSITGNNVLDQEIRYFNGGGVYGNQAAGNVYGTLTVL